MAFLVKQMVGDKISGVKGGLDKLTGGEKKEGDEAAKTETGEDPEVIQARIEQEERRKEKHRRMEQDREKMRQGVRDKYGIAKKDENAVVDDDDDCSRVGAAKRKTPEELAKEGEIDDSPMGMAKSYLDKAKTGVTGAVDMVKGLLPFGK